MTAPVVLAALLFWCCVFATYFASQGKSPAEYLFGRYEPLPDDLGAWKELGLDVPSQLMREERMLLPPGRPGSGRLLHQVRYRDPVTRAVVRVEPERRVRRRRVRPR